MKIAIVNTYSKGSTGTIAHLIGEYANNQGNEVRYFYGRVKDNSEDWNYIGENKFNQFLSNGFTYLTGNVGSFHTSSTKKLLKELEKFKPDVIHLHNLHGNYLNFKLLFNYLKSFNGKVVITCHDEFLLTGRCALCACNKWKEGCNKCKFLKAYPRAFIDHSKRLQQEKHTMLNDVKDLTIVVPSNWLKQCFNSSLIKSLDCRCINNGLPESKEEEFDVSALIDKNKINVLFAAFTWSPDKGSKVINEISEKIDNNKYNIIVAGVEKYCSNWFGNNCKKIGLLSREKLFYLLKQVDIFANPTYKDNLPTVLIESLKAGTPAITFNTGGCFEIIDQTCGMVLDDKTGSGLLNAINAFSFEKCTKENCFRKAENFSSEKMAKAYLSIYKEKSE